MIYRTTNLYEIIISDLGYLTGSKRVFQPFGTAYCIYSFADFALSLRNRYIIELPFYLK